jgi:hypothetical protein
MSVRGVQCARTLRIRKALLTSRGGCWRRTTEQHIGHSGLSLHNRGPVTYLCMKKHLTTTITLPLLTLLMIASFTHVDAQVGSGLTGSTGNGVSVGTSADARATTSIDGSIIGNVDERVGSSDGRVGVDGDVSVSSDVDARAPGSAAISSDTGLRAAQDIGSIEAESGIPLSTRVETEEQLEAYTRAVAAASPEIVEARTSESEVIVVSRGEGRLFGLMPVTLVYETRVKLHAQNGSRVSVSLPWWHIFTRKSFDEAQVEQQVRARVETVLASRTQAENEVAVKAQVVEAVAGSFTAQGEVATQKSVEVR